MKHVKIWLVILMSAIYMQSIAMKQGDGNDSKRGAIPTTAIVLDENGANTDVLLITNPMQARLVADRVLCRYEDALRSRGTAAKDRRKALVKSLVSRVIPGMSRPVIPTVFTRKEVMNFFESQCSYFAIGGLEPDIFDWLESDEHPKKFIATVVNSIVETINQKKEQPVTVVSLGARDLLVDLIVLAQTKNRAPGARIQFYSDSDQYLQEDESEVQFPAWFTSRYSGTVQVRDDLEQNPVPDVVYARNVGPTKYGDVVGNYNGFCRLAAVNGGPYRGVLFTVDDGHLILSRHSNQRNSSDKGASHEQK